MNNSTYGNALHIMMNVIMASVVKLNVIRQSDVMVSVLAPSKHLFEFSLQKFA